MWRTSGERAASARAGRAWGRIGLSALSGLTAVTIAGCQTTGSSRTAGGRRPGVSKPAPSTPTPSTSVVSGSTTRVPRAAKPYDTMLRRTLKSVASYWAQQMPDVYAKPYKPMAGGVYAYSQDSIIPPCGGFPLPYLILQQNAFYCPESDFIAWDDQGLFPRLESRYGPFLLSIVVAHEWGHAIQKQNGVDALLDGVFLEQQADCFAGSWGGALEASAEPELTALRDADLDRALAGFVEFRDRLGMTADDLGAHGTAFDRIRAFQDGYENGAGSCADYETDTPTLVAVPYRSFKERFRGGNLPYDQVIDTVTSRIDGFWRDELGALTSPTFERSDAMPFCSAPPRSPEGFADSELSWCADNDVVYYSDSLLEKVYADVGDFGVATELALTRALVHEVSSGADVSRKDVWLRAVCTVGAWTGSMYEPDSPESSLLSPGDVDEGVRTLLEYATRGSRVRYGTGFEQVAAYRTGVLGSSGACGVPVIS